MATALMSTVLRHLRQAALRPDGGEMPDGQLLERFLSRRDEAAFESLVRRHGPMVLGVCRRTLNNAHDAEDAFQATFLVLVRKAAELLPRQTVGNWLYGVACHTAQKARAAIAKRRAKEQQMRDLPRPEVAAVDTWQDWRPLLDQELSRLPDKYREAVVLCDLEGKTRKEAARQLNLPVGTLSGRLTSARRMLAKRLARHRLLLPGGVLAAALAPNTAAASVPIALTLSTVRAASLFAAGQALVTGGISTKVVALTEGVLNAMLLTKLKTTAAVLLLLGAVTIGTGAVLLPGPGSTPQSGRNEALPQPQPRRAGEPTAAALFRTRTYDVGDIAGERQVSCSFQMENHTKETYRLAGVRVADPAVAASPRSVELTPDDTGTIAVWLDSARFRGKKTFQVWVHFSAPREEQVLLELKAVHVPEGKIPTEERLREVEKQLQRLLQEVQKLRKDLRP